MVVSRIGHGPKWLFAKIDPQPGEFGAGSRLYKGDVNQMLVSSGILFYCLTNGHDDNYVLYERS